MSQVFQKGLRVNRNGDNGFLLLEVLIAVVILGICLSITTMTQRLLVQTQTRQQSYLHQLQKRRILESQFVAHLRRFGLFGCSGVPRLLEIGHASNFPLHSKTPMPNSDWLRGEDVGLCASEAQKESTYFEGNLKGCTVPSRGQFILDTCSVSFSVDPMFNKDRSFNLTPPIDLEAEGGILATSEKALWYLANSSSGQGSLWKKSQIAYAAQEIERGVQYIAFYPLLDTNGDGKANLITKQYGAVSSSQLMGLWIEYVYRFSICSDDASVQKYTNFRSNTWHYRSDCEAVAGYLLPMRDA